MRIATLCMCLLIAACSPQPESPHRDSGPQQTAQTARTSLPAENKKTEDYEPMTLTGEFTYAADMDEGTYFTFSPNKQARLEHPSVSKNLWISNVNLLSKLIKLPSPIADGGNSYHCTGYSGTASITIDPELTDKDVQIDEEEFEKRQYAKLIAFEKPTVTRRECTDLEGQTWPRDKSTGNIQHVRQLVEALDVLDPQGVFDDAKGLYTLGVSYSAYLPEPGSPIFVVAGMGASKSYLNIMRMQGGEWQESKVLECEDTICPRYQLSSGEPIHIVDTVTGDKWFYKNGAFERR